MSEYPNNKNACSGRFKDWLEVCLTPECNGRCKWCVDRKGWHPKTMAPWDVIVDGALNTGKKNIILLGGEPTLHPDIKRIIARLARADRNVYVTTNGSRLTKKWTQRNLRKLHKVNISIHSFDLEANKKITGIRLRYKDLADSISWLRAHKIDVRMNCNCIKGYIDNWKGLHGYIDFAKTLGASSVRFAELKYDEDSFVDLGKVCEHQYGLNVDPFKWGCSHDAVIDAMPVNFRQMCGFQTSLRPRPENPMFDTSKKVLYYDGKLYAGWQMEEPMENDVIIMVLQKVKDGSLSPEEGARLINNLNKEPITKVVTKTIHASDGGYCHY